MEETGNGEREEEAERRARTDTGKGREREREREPLERERERERERARERWERRSVWREGEGRAYMRREEKPRRSGSRGGVRKETGDEKQGTREEPGQIPYWYRRVGPGIDARGQGTSTLRGRERLGKGQERTRTNDLIV